MIFLTPFATKSCSITNSAQILYIISQVDCLNQKLNCVDLSGPNWYTLSVYSLAISKVQSLEKLSTIISSIFGYV